MYLGGGRDAPRYANVQRVALEICLGRPLVAGAFPKAECGNNLCIETTHLREHVPERRDDYIALKAKILARSKPAQDGSGCRLWSGPVNRKTGYGHVSVGHDTCLAHRVALECKLGRPLARGMGTLHSCDNRRCVEFSHLSEGTASDNNQDTAAKDRTIFGVRHHNAKLDPEKVRIIRSGLASSSDLARRFGVTQGLINLVRQRKIWIRVT